MFKNFFTKSISLYDFLRKSAVIIFVLVFISVCMFSKPSYAGDVKELKHQKNTFDASPDTGHSIDVARSKGHVIAQRYSPAGSIITEINTGQILWSENRNVEWTPASMSKLMTIALAYDAIRDKKISLDTVVTVKEKHVRIGKNSKLSNNNMQLGCTYTVAEIIDLIIVPSSAAATYLMMDLLAPDIDTYVAMLNKKAAELNMVNTRYVNPVGVLNYLLGEYAPSGDPNDDNYTSPQDYACLCSYLVENYPDLLNHTKHANIVVKQGTKYEEKFHGYNFSLEGTKYAFPGADGIKTGSARNGYNYSMTAKRGNTRMIEIVLGVSKWEDLDGEYYRHPIGNAILEDAFAKYEYKKILDKGIYKIDGKTIEIVKPLYDCVPKKWKEDFVCDFKKNTIKAKIVNREYLPGYSEPSTKFTLTEETAAESTTSGSIIKRIISIVIIVLILLIVLSIIRYRNIQARRKYRRRRRHHR